MRNVSFTSATQKKPGKLVTDFLTFHQCGNWSAYEAMCREMHDGDFALAALTEGRRTKHHVDPTLLTTWLRAGEMLPSYEEGRSFSFHPDNLRGIMPALKQRAAHPDEELLRDLSATLREVGVVFQIVPPPEGLPMHGATRWIDQRVPVIQQSGRRNTDGYLIWTFFHEIGHVLNDPRGETHLDLNRTQKQRSTASEKTANAFALEELFGSAGLGPFQGLERDADIRKTAERLGVAPGVAILLMHRRRMLDYKYGNSLSIDLSGTF